jgi:transcriptional regulator with XRE-family HTH domain
VIAFAVSDLRKRLAWTQAELGRRADVSQAFVSSVENLRITDLTFNSANRLLAAMGAQLTVGISAPFLADRELQNDPVHARCAAYVAVRLKRAGWETAGEVEIGGDRSRGWIDLLAYHPQHRLLLVIEVKTEIRDVGSIERTLGWYERESWAAAQRLGWRPRTVLGCLLVLATDVNDVRLIDNRAAMGNGFPIRSMELDRILTDAVEPPRRVRALAMIDPRSHRQRWLRPSRLDGRRTPAPYVDYADLVRASHRSGRHISLAEPGASSANVIDPSDISR